MSNADLLQLIGTVALFGFAYLLVWVARRAHRFDRYGREALACAAAWIFVVGLMRILNICDVVGLDVVRSVNTLGAIAFLVILGEVIWIRRIEAGNRATR